MEISRRSFLFLTGGTGAAAAVEPGRQILNKLIPWVIPPENIRPGDWAFFATTCRECPAGCGMYLMHRDGRVTKAEAHPEHPVSRGGLCPRGQSSVQGLYDPDRVTQVLQRNSEGKLDPASWEKALEVLTGKLKDGGRIAILSDLQTGALAEVMHSFVRTFGSDRLLFYEAFNYEPLRAAHQSVFGRNEIPEYRLEECEFILSFGADFLETWVSPVGLARGYAHMHSLQGEGMIGHFAYVGPRQSMTAANADDFVQVSPGRERWVALAMLQEMADRGWIRQQSERLRKILSDLGGRNATERSGVPAEKIRKLARDFSRKKSVALAGPMGASGPVARDTAVAAALLNLAAGRLGETVSFDRVHSLGKTATDAELNRFLRNLTAEDVLFVVHSNPFFTLPESAKELRRAGTLVHLTTMPDETAEEADWVLPVDSPLESWGDYEPYSAIHGLMQPTMARLYDSRMAGDFFIALADAAGRPLQREGGAQDAPNDFHSWLRQRWLGLYREAGAQSTFNDFWRESLRRGGYWGPPPGEGTGVASSGGGTSFAAPVEASPTPERTDLWLWPSIYLFDGRLANRAWMQEMPHPVSTIVWGSWVDLHPEKARALGVSEGDVVEIATTEGSIEVPVRITLEVTPETAAVPIGQGHSARGFSVAQGVGANPFRLLGGKMEGMFARATLRKTGRVDMPVYVSATRHQHHREILQQIPLKEAKKLRPGEGEPLILPTPAGYDPDRDIYSGHEHRNHRWAMAIDLQKCIGCHACSVACYAENNIPVVGKLLVAKGREMSWLRVPPYRDQENPMKISWLPLPCQHCDAAPCEPVCPVFAAVHNEEGLNAQIYNRCIGTRYCSNNCPYKVRRFNWFNVLWKPPLEMQLNPEVTVRSRGVMEKCTFCVQRIRYAEYQARLEDRPVRDGEIVPACVQTCPAGVFTFGDLMDEKSQIYRIFKEHPRRYQVLRELNTKPAVAYLKKIRIEDEDETA